MPTSTKLLSKVGAFEIDVIGDVLDNCRSWQLRTILIIYLTKIPTAFFMACIVYTAPIPQRVPIYCKNMTESQTITIKHHPPIISKNDKEFDLSYCDTFADIKDHALMHYGHDKYEMPWNAPNLTRSGIVVVQSNIVPCNHFNFKSSNSVTTYDVVCSRGGLVVVTQGMHLVGILLSGIVLRYSTKIISPKNVMRSAMILQIICGNFAGFVQSFGMHLILRALAAIGCATAFGAGSMIYITRAQFKIAALVLFDTFWSVGIIILSFITEFESRWTELYYVISNPTVIIVFLTIWIPDSPRWLLSHGDIQGTFKILVQAARYCNSTTNLLPANLAFKLKLQARQLLRQRSQEANWLNMWTDSVKTSLLVLSIHVAFACFTIMYFGMVLNMPNYGRNHLAKSARLIASSELTGCCMGCVLVMKTKRKFLWSGMFNILGASIAYWMWFWKDRETEFVDDGILLYFCLILKASVSSSFGILSACATDSVKKDAKAIMMLSSVLCGRLFLLNAPVIVTLGTFYGEYLSLTLFCTLGVIGGLSMITVDFLKS